MVNLLRPLILKIKELSNRFDTLGSVATENVVPVEKGGTNADNAAQARENLEVHTLSNPNILINGNFQVNQRGQSEYTSTDFKKTYTVDRWRLENGKLTVNDGYVKLTGNVSGGNYLSQTLEKLPKGTYTATIKVKALSGSCKFYNDVTGASDVDILSVGKRVITFTTDEERTFFGIYVMVTGIDSYIDIEYIKLEQGTVETPFIPRLYEEELSLCEKYYNLQGYIFSILYKYSSTQFLARAIIPKMRIQPSIISSMIQAYNASGNSITAETDFSPGFVGNAISVVTKFPADVKDSEAAFWGYLELDAEIY